MSGSVCQIHATSPAMLGLCKECWDTVPKHLRTLVQDNANQMGVEHHTTKAAIRSAVRIARYAKGGTAVQRIPTSSPRKTEML